MKSNISIEIFNHERLKLGEGPIAYGTNNEHIAWVDILGQKVLKQELSSSAASIENMGCDVSFLIPQSDGGLLLGSNPTIKSETNTDISISRHKIDSEPTRWNDAKVGPSGELWLGSMSYAETSGAAALYRWRSGDLFPQKQIGGTTVSNGLAWSSDKSKMYFIDSPTQSLQVFSYAEGEILGKVEVFNFSQEYGYPDGLCIDSEDGLWVAFWMGSAVRRFDTKQGFKETHIINTPAARTTSCVFAGANLDKLIITSAHMDDPTASESAGKTFICEPGVIGTPTSQLIVD